MYLPPRYMVTTWQAASGAVFPQVASTLPMASARFAAATVGVLPAGTACVTLSVTSVISCNWSMVSPWQARSSARVGA